MDPESLSRYHKEENFPYRLVSIMEEKLFTIYRKFDLDKGESEVYFTVINEEDTPRKEYRGRTLMEAFDLAFPE